MRAHPPYYQIHRALVDHFAHLRPAAAHGLALWVSGTLLAHSACESAVLAVLAPLGKRETLRQRLRDCLRTSEPIRRIATIIDVGDKYDRFVLDDFAREFGAGAACD